MSNSRSKKNKPRGLRDGVEEDTSKPTAVFRPSGGRKHTLTVALPGSIITKYGNFGHSHAIIAVPSTRLSPPLTSRSAQSHELKTVLAGQIARALAVFCVDEVVIFDDGASAPTNGFQHGNGHNANGGFNDSSGYTAHSDPVHFLAHILSFMEAPPHLRKSLFSLHPNLRTAGTLPSLDMPHHFRTGEWCRWRDGIVVPDPRSSPPPKRPQQPPNKKRKGSHASPPEPETSKYADIGLHEPARLPEAMPVHSRVTLDLHSSSAPWSKSGEPLKGTPVTQSAPREEGGYYWGYAVRTAKSLSAVYTESPFSGGYDLSVGTSERGVALAELATLKPEIGKQLQKYEHMVVFFGGLAGLERAVQSDQTLREKGVTDASECFDAWVDVCSGQGSRTIRTEEAVWLGLAGLWPWVRNRGGEKHAEVG